MQNISKAQLEKMLDYSKLVQTLRQAFREDFVIPKRHHHNFQNPTADIESTLLVMPAWQVGKYLGVKIVTISPQNGEYDLPAIHGVYTLFDAHVGKPLAQIDAATLTAHRTAATSALASSFLSNKNSNTLLMVGTGKLAPELIRAHSAVRPIEKVFIWGRNFEKAKSLASSFTEKNIAFVPIKNIEEEIEKADIISCATLSFEPLIFGKNLVAGQHLDLVGAYRPEMRESDDDAILRSSVYVDTYDGAEESGDILTPMKNEILGKENICGDLFELCRGEKLGRKKETEITLFKSVGHALEDLAAAKLAYEFNI